MVAAHADTLGALARKAAIYTGESVTRQLGRDCLSCLHNNEPYHCPHVKCQPVSRLVETISKLAAESETWETLTPHHNELMRERLLSARNRLAELINSAQKQLDYVKSTDQAASRLLDYLMEDDPS